MWRSIGNDVLMNTGENYESESRDTRTMEPIDRALDLALIVMQNGGSTRLAEASFKNILKGYNQRGVSAAWRLDFVAVTSGGRGQSSTVLRPVGPIGVNLARVSQAVVLGERFSRGEVNTTALISEIQRIKALIPPLNRWGMAAAAALGAAAFSRIGGGDWGALAAAIIAAGIGQFVRSLLQDRKLPVAPVTLCCSVLSAFIAAAGLRLGLSQTAPATVIASVIYMVPGLPLINGFVDLVSHKHLILGLERIANAAYLFLVIAVAIALVYTVVM